MAEPQFYWDRYILCQLVNKDHIQRPTCGKTQDSGVGYFTLSQNIQRLHELNSLPMDIHPLLLGETIAVVKLMKENGAGWHKNCNNLFNTKNDQRAEKRKAPDPEKNDTSDNKVTRKSCGGATKQSQNTCFLCPDSTNVVPLHNVSTFETDKRIRECAMQIQDTVLLAKLSAGDLISQEAAYHAKCLAALYKKTAKLMEGSTDTESRRIAQLEGIALAELISYIEESSIQTGTLSTFKLADLCKLYSDRLEQIGVQIEGRVNSTHLKNRILSHFPDMQTFKDGRNVILAFDKDLAAALKKVMDQDFDNEAMILKQAANIIRRDILKGSIVKAFPGTFHTSCQQDSVPAPLLSLVQMILGGPNISSSTCSFESQWSASIAQLLLFNCISDRAKKGNHSTVREPPLPIYIGLLLHAETRKKGLIDKMHDLGLSVSYDRVLSLSTELGNKACARFMMDGVVCPSKLRHQVFTTSAVDNIDHNPSSSTAKGSLHGTGISLFQHPRIGNEGQERTDLPSDTVINSNKLTPLPESYTAVQPVVLPKRDPAIPARTPLSISDEAALESEYRWLKHVKEEIEAEASTDLKTSWAAYHADQIHTEQPASTDISSLLPLFYEEANSSAMIAHTMKVVKNAVNFLNPGQIPVVACDQPLYAIAKQLQWQYPNIYGENQVVVMFGGLHIELAFLKVLGDWLEGTGWTNTLVQAEIASQGTADSFLKAAHIMRTRHAHQVTAGSLYILMDRAYKRHQTEDHTTDPLSFEQWRVKMENAVPMFNFWSITLDLELALMVFLQSLRQGIFNLYTAALTKLAPWFFALDHPNYARWIAVHIRDMASINLIHPEVAAEFSEGKFVVHKTPHSFSGIPLDQAHEQNNKQVKGDGGAVGLTENSAQLQRWMVAGPEVSRVVNVYETVVEGLRGQAEKHSDQRHHEAQQGVQTTYRKQVKFLCDALEDMGNPFMEDSSDLLVLGTQDVVDNEIIETVRHIKRVGNEQYSDFVKERLEDRTKSLTDPIKRNKFPLFSSQPTRKVSKEKQQIASLKQDCSLFSKLYVSCQVRNGDIDEFFRHENQSSPPSLSQCGKLRHGTKADLLPFLTQHSIIIKEKTDTDAVLLDGAAIVNMLNAGASRTFQEYADQIFVPHVERQLESARRVDIIFDQYFQNSMKATARSLRGEGYRRKVKANTPVPRNWKAFLRCDANKTELFSFLADQCTTVSCPEGKQIMSTKGELVLCNPLRDSIDQISPCTHEEADARLLLHAKDAVQHGCERIMIRTVDTDVVVLAIALCLPIHASELWISFGVGDNFKYIPVHTIAGSLGLKCRAMPMFHAFSGCDNTSSFAGKGKKSSWETWQICESVTEIFADLGNVPTLERIDQHMANLERFVVLLYDKTSTATSADEARKDIFTRKGRSIDLIPPTSAALYQHVRRACYQAGHIWGQSLLPNPRLPSPVEWGWMKGPGNAWEPYWSDLPQASVFCMEFLKCGCVKGCRGRCKCVKAQLAYRPKRPENITLVTSSSSEVVEGQNVSFICIGDVGNPPGKFIWKKYRNNGHIPETYLNITTTYEKVPDNCTYYGTSVLSIQLTSQDNNASFMCVEESLASFDSMGLMTGHINVYYKIRNVTVTKTPDMEIYPTDRIKDLNLTCNADGNPAPKYSLFREENPGTILSETNTLNIKDLVVNKSGNYVCIADNIINFYHYNKTAKANITIADRIDFPPENETATKINWTELILKVAGSAFLVATVVVLIYCCLKGRCLKRNKTGDIVSASNNQSIPLSSKVELSTEYATVIDKNKMEPISSTGLQKNEYADVEIRNSFRSTEQI